MEGDLLNATVTHLEVVMQDSSDLVHLDTGGAIGIEGGQDLLRIPDVPLLGKHVTDAGTDLFLPGLLSVSLGGKLPDPVLPQLLVPEKSSNKVRPDTVSLSNIFLTEAFLTVKSDHVSELLGRELLLVALPGFV